MVKDIEPPFVLFIYVDSLALYPAVGGGHWLGNRAGFENALLPVVRQTERSSDALEEALVLSLLVRQQHLSTRFLCRLSLLVNLLFACNSAVS